MKNLVLAVLLLVGATAGGCALFLTPVFVMSPYRMGDMALLWGGLAMVAALAIWASTRLPGPRGWRLWLLWGVTLALGLGGWVLFLRAALRNM